MDSILARKVTRHASEQSFVRYSDISVIFEEYAKDDNIGTLLASLRTIARAQGITATAVAAGMTRKSVQKALSEQGHPKFESVNAILHALGYQLAPQKFITSNTEA